MLLLNHEAHIQPLSSWRSSCHHLSFGHVWCDPLGTSALFNISGLVDMIFHEGPNKTQQLLHLDALCVDHVRTMARCCSQCCKRSSLQLHRQDGHFVAFRERKIGVSVKFSGIVGVMSLHGICKPQLSSAKQNQRVSIMCGSTTCLNSRAHIIRLRPFCQSPCFLCS